MAGTKERWTLPLASGHEDHSYELVPADPDHSPLLSSTENGQNITPRGPKNQFIRKLARTRHRIQRLPRSIALVIFILAPLATVLAVIVFAYHRANASSPLEPPSALEPPPILNPNDPIDAARLHVDALFARQSATYAHAAARYSLKTGRAPPRGYDKWFAFAQEQSCLIDEYDQIQRDFAPFYDLAKHDPLFFQRRVDIAANVNHPVREAGGLVIKDGKVHMPQGVDLGYWGGGPATFSKFAHLLPDMTFVVNGKDQPRVVFDYREPGNATRDRALLLTEDGHPFELVPHPTTAEFFRQRPGCEVLRSREGFAEFANDDSAFFLSSSPAYFTLDLYPVLSVTKVSPCFADIVFPSEYYYQRASTAPKFAYSDNVAWEDKKAQIYWRGTATGGQIVGDNYHNFTRFKLVDLSNAHPDLVDAKITRFADLLCLGEDGCDREKIVQEYGIGGANAPQENAYGYKYLLDVDGMTYSGRFLGILRSGGLVFKATVFEEYFNDWIRPYEHYIPVLPDLSDLLQKIEWARAHDAEARMIQERGREMAERVMTDAQNDCYFFALLLEWAQLQEIARNASAS
ncbi:glycosyl transferase family 90-domain-containing protein [Mycena alexandri]|uniref:Glycosyl transferase family 90-domain-containing protein n=1 Tax=Mycena alexandri TaxID=1745969 RepID=A0AAD6T5J6_9AGAR|nr:glycosyl transferase family 90-domain-containing protein [Mycena alexandri]